MKKSILFLALLGTAMGFQEVSAQLAAKKGVTMEELGNEINTLAQKGDDASKAQLLKEADALAKSKNEDFLTLGSRLYSFLEKPDQADAISNSITKKFPKGKKARGEAFEKFFTKEATAATADKAYQAWLKKFPASSFDEKDRAIYDLALSNLATLYFKENNTTKATAYVSSLGNSKSFSFYGSNIANELIKSGKYTEALPILDEAIKKSNSTGGPAEKQTYIRLVPAYAKVLIEQNQTDKGVSLLEDFFKTNPAASNQPESVVTLSKGYANQGKNLDAFLSLDKFIVKNGKNEAVVKAIEPLYNSLNANKGNFQQYIAGLDAQVNEALLAKYKSEMIKKEAPLFSLANRQGETVSLADLKGKVVVLDFWATWCGPCKISFPGMQAAVNKYKDDKDVVFLFIDTWQREENYKELVNKFIDDNKYTFNVLFDEMGDRTKATTASYGVKGIPHKVVIDKEGFIRFESSGGIADVEKIVKEMETKIELARKG